jgi:hypothetical protein
VLALRITVNMHTSTFVCSHMVCGPTDTDQSLGSSRKGWEGGSRDPPRLDYDGRDSQTRQRARYGNVRDQAASFARQCRRHVIRPALERVGRRTRLISATPLLADADRHRRHLNLLPVLCLIFTEREGVSGGARWHYE